MTDRTQNIIAIREKSTEIADKAFADFMSLAEDCLNESAVRNGGLFKRSSPGDMEKIALNALWQVSPQTPFRKENIVLCSGLRFPDIVAERFYGVEVKSTKEDSWRSTGSSIVENTRIEDVSRIYMLFAKLGGDVAMFRCRPYESCLSNIAVTHSPRYLVDMALTEGKGKTIFQKMGISYDDFRALKEKEKIAFVRNYYKRQGSKKQMVMPWWMGGDSASEVNISFYNDISKQKKEELQARMFILFPCVFNSEFKPLALWICNRYSLLCPNMRDLFTAGGKVVAIGEKTLKAPVPHIVLNLYNLREQIARLLESPDKTLLEDIADCWGEMPETGSLYSVWKRKMAGVFRCNRELTALDINDLFPEN